MRGFISATYARTVRNLNPVLTATGMEFMLRRDPPFVLAPDRGFEMLDRYDPSRSFEHNGLHLALVRTNVG
jgi:hypothetical protein